MRKQRATALISLGTITGAILVSTAVARHTHEPDAPQQVSGAESREPFSVEQMTGMLGQQLVSGLKSTPGCLGADAASFTSGKLAIFGWFEDKEAALAWHSSKIHKEVSARFSGGRMMNNEPMEHIPDGVPLMVIASVVVEPTEGGQPRMTFGIEVYEPMPGGFSFRGGAFSPDGFQSLMAEIRDNADD